MYLPPRRNALRERIAEEVVPAVPRGSYHECPDERLPLKYGLSPWTIVLCCLPYATGTPRTDAVYVLECQWTSNYREHTAIHTGNPSPAWAGNVDGAERLLYVGVTANLIRRLNEHLNTVDKGADFTKVFPPIRVLDVSWYPSYPVARKAERITAHLLQDEFPDDFVAQPG